MQHYFLSAMLSHGAFETLVPVLSISFSASCRCVERKRAQLPGAVCARKNCIDGKND